jgi:hypothetical protein
MLVIGLRLGSPSRAGDGDSLAFHRFALDGHCDFEDAVLVGGLLPTPSFCSHVSPAAAATPIAGLHRISPSQDSTLERLP